MKKKKNISPVLTSLIIGGALGFGLVVLLNGYLKDFMSIYVENENELIELFKVYSLFLVFFIAYYIHIIIHEGGHLLFGIMTGYSFVSFRIGSFTIIKEEGKLKKKKFNLPGTAGQCLMMPPPLRDGEFPFIIYNLGGVLANLITSILLILIANLVKNNNIFLQGILVLAAAGGIFAVLTNGIPMKIGGVPNDGYNILSMLKDEEAQRGFYVQLKVNGLLTQGERIKDMSLEMFKVKEGSDLSNPLNTSLRLMEYSWYLDNLDFEKAKECINSFESSFDKLAPLFRNEINCERMFLELVGDCNKTIIEDLYDKNLKRYVKAGKFMISRKRLLMAYEGFYNKDKSKALSYYEATKDLAEKYPIKGDAYTELMLVEWIKEKLDAVFP